jgi:sugar phosphate isomerase/epimerase
MNLTRRSVFQMASAAVVRGARAGRFAPGVQLYTVRDLLQKNPEDTLRAISQIGYREVEMLRGQVRSIVPLLAQFELQPVSLHFETPLLTGNYTAWQHADMPPIDKGASYEESIGLARDHGFRYIVFNYLTPEERLGLDFYRSLAGKLNAAAEKARRAGLQFCYHNHDFEFQPKDGGRRPMDVLLERLDRKLILLEVDVFWVSMAGVDAAEYLRQNAARVALVHLKDRAPGTPVHYDIATVPNETFRAVGSGDLPLGRILPAIAESQAQHVFVEQDFSPDPVASLRESYAYLKRAGFYR